MLRVADSLDVVLAHGLAIRRPRPRQSVRLAAKKDGAGDASAPEAAEVAAAGGADEEEVEDDEKEDGPIERSYWPLVLAAAATAARELGLEEDYV